MERASLDQFTRISLRDEHIHRYEMAARVARGVVVDCACGIGYSSEIITRQQGISSYLGIDPSNDAIITARENYSGSTIRFETGTLELNSCGVSSVDTFLSFETLEHTATPLAALKNIHHCLKPDGLLIGSVPSADYEAICEATYGPNPFHLNRFSPERISRMLSGLFESVRLFSAEFILGTLIRPFDSDVTHEGEILTRDHSDIGISGSIIFLAGSSKRVNEALNTLGSGNKFFPSIPKVILDRDEVLPIRESFVNAEKKVQERDILLEKQARILDERWKAMQSMESMIRDRDHVIEQQTRTLDERWKAMQSMESMIRERDKVIERQMNILEKRTTVSGFLKILFAAVVTSIKRTLHQLKGAN